MTEAEVVTPKGRETRESVLGVARNLASTVGLDGLTIGTLADSAGMSKSGLYAHFGSKEDLQCAVLDATAEDFKNTAVLPAFKAPRGIPRIEKLFWNWVEWEGMGHDGGCPILAAATEYDDRPGAIRDKTLDYVSQMIGVLDRAAQIAIEEGHFRADLDTRQFAYELWGVLLAQQHYLRLLETKDAPKLAKGAFDSMIDRARPQA